MTPEQFISNLNDYYLETHENADLNFPEIPSSNKILETNVIHIYNLLSNINTKKATSTADYPSWITRNNAYLLAQPITHIVNEILSDSYFPALWKQSQITPINKVKTPHKYKDMRPIALTFHLGKINERVISDLIKCDLPKMRNQYAYTKELSTTDALVKFSSDKSAGLDKTDAVTLQALLLNFSKAFDRMRPDIAVSKLLSLNVSPSLVKVDFNIIYYVLPDKSPTASEIAGQTLKTETEQNWSTARNNSWTNHIKYADDTTLYNTVRLGDVEISDSTALRAIISFTQKPLQEAASYAAAWCDSNEMLLNTTKSMCISFTLQKHLTVEPININGCKIEQKEEVKLLGVTFDSHMRFSTHVDNIIRRTKPAFHAIIRLKKSGLTPTNYCCSTNLESSPSSPTARLAGTPTYQATTKRNWSDMNAYVCVLSYQTLTLMMNNWDC